MPEVNVTISARVPVTVQLEQAEGTLPCVRVSITPFAGKPTSEQAASEEVQRLVAEMDDRIARSHEARWGQGNVRSNRSVNARSTRFTSGLLAISSSIERSFASSRLFRSAQAAITTAMTSVRNPTDLSRTIIIACTSALLSLSMFALLLLLIGAGECSAPTEF
jgi:hypothetical protein